MSNRIIKIELILILLTIVFLTVVKRAHSHLPNKLISTQQREFPNTRDGIYIFYDQLPFSLTDAQLQFVAQHYVGCQKIPRDLVNAIRSYNDNFIVINYRLAFGTYSNIPGYLDGNDWINDWDTVNPHVDWFITNIASQNPGGRIKQSDWGWYLMDISGEVNGNKTDGWKEYWVSTVLHQLKNTNCDGVFADSYCFPWNLDFTPYWLTPIQDTVWIHHMQVFGNYVRDQFAIQPEKFYFIPNVGPWVTTRNTCDYGAFVHGIMVEMFASWGPWDLFELEDWKLQMNRILDLERSGKIVICQPITEDEWAVGERMFNLANYLLIKGEKTYYNLVFGENFYGRLIFFPECTINLGPYIGVIPQDIDEMYNQSSGLYVREYQNGKVLVNPTWNEITINLNKEYYAIDTDDLVNDPQIDIREDGIFWDSVAFKRISGSLTVGYKGGVILLNSVELDINKQNFYSSKNRFTLLENFPNPFNNITHINFHLPMSNAVYRAVIKIFDISGREVNSINTNKLQPGKNSIPWNGVDNSGCPVTSGVYFYSLKVNCDNQTMFIDNKKMLLLR